LQNLYLVTRLLVGQLGFESWHSRVFLFASRLALRPTQPPVQWVLEFILSFGVKWPGCEANHSPSPSAKIKNAWHYTSTPPYICMEWCLVKNQGFTLFLSYYAHTNKT
jgi:hypothetical protein